MMEIIKYNINNIPSINEPISLAIGNFDGIHLGHQELLKGAKNTTYKSAVMTFNPHPSEVLKNIKPYMQLTNLEHKIRLIESFDIDYLFVVEFTKEFSKSTKEDFINMLKALNVKRVVCGYDFTFALRGSGTPNDLREHFDVLEVKKFLVDDVRVSSTYIKECLQMGDMETACKLLGRPYTMIGKVFQGRQIGRTIGYRTANLDYNSYYIPHRGVYATRVLHNGNIYYGMTNVGFNPTVDYKESIKVEVHIFNFNEDIYGDEIEILFDHKIRNEHKFSNLNELKNQLTHDFKEIANYYKLGGNNYEINGCYHQ